MLAGHMDEIGFVVKLITDEGFIKFSPLGGWWGHVMLAQRVVIRTRKGDVTGVIGSKPPHVLDDEERKKVQEPKDMYIDVGATSSDEVKALDIRPGDPIVPICPFTVLGTGKTSYFYALYGGVRERQLRHQSGSLPRCRGWQRGSGPSGNLSERVIGTL